MGIASIVEAETAFTLPNFWQSLNTAAIPDSSKKLKYWFRSRVLDNSAHKFRNEVQVGYDSWGFIIVGLLLAFRSVSAAINFGVVITVPGKIFSFIRTVAMRLTTRISDGSSLKAMMTNTTLVSKICYSFTCFFKFSVDAINAVHNCYNPCCFLKCAWDPKTGEPLFLNTAGESHSVSCNIPQCC